MRQLRPGFGAMRPMLAYSAMLAMPVGALAEVAAVKATFLGDGTYATADGCKKLKALVNGSERNISTVPETLTSDGFESWEGGCTFTSIKEVDRDKKWAVEMHCSEGPEEGPENDTFERLPDGKIKVTAMDNVTVFERCDAE